MISINELALQHLDESTALLVKCTVDKVNVTIKKGVPTHTSFLNPYQVALIKKMLQPASQQIDCTEFKLSEASEMSVLAFMPSGIAYKPESPLATLRFDYCSRFTSISHRDVLGSLMHLGIKRETIGDIIVGEGSGYISVLRDMKLFIETQFVQIKNAGITLSEVQPADVPVLEPQYETMTVTLSSLRADALVQVLTQQSREKAQQMIRGQKVKCNYALCLSNSHEVKAGDMISMRGYGRFYLEAVLGETKKNKIRVIVKTRL